MWAAFQQKYHLRNGTRVSNQFNNHLEVCLMNSTIIDDVEKETETEVYTKVLFAEMKVS